MFFLNLNPSKEARYILHGVKENVIEYISILMIEWNLVSTEIMEKQFGEEEQIGNQNDKQRKINLPLYMSCHINQYRDESERAS